ncbi:atherin-like [Pyrgilauda ruficollis]|uniref:atherin-like n=1 Tax=Pyrgilauda ruficollis TaxID=221976 RepID=UPI001B88581D|nr:atherin-like [Pyrgilauda ruficollis]
MRASRRSRRPAGAPGPARPPGRQGRHQHLQLRHRSSGAPAAGPARGKTLAPDSRRANDALREQSVLPAAPSRLGRRAPRPGAAPLRSPAQPRGAPGGRAAPARPALRQLPARHPPVVRGEPPCSRLTPGRARSPRPLERRVFNGAEGASAPGATATAAGSSACGTARQRLPCPPRSGPVAPQSCARPVPVIAARKAGDAVPPSPPRPPAAVLLTRPEPPLSRRGIPANSTPLSPPPRQPRSPPEPTAHCPPPPAGEGAPRPGRGGARRGASRR